MAAALGVKQGRLAVFHVDTASARATDTGTPPAEIIRGGLRRTLVPYGVNLLRGAGIRARDAFVLVLDNDRTSVACMLGAMELQCTCLLVGKSRIGLLAHVLRHSALTKVVTVNGNEVVVEVKSAQAAAQASWTEDTALLNGGVCLLTSGSVGEPKIVACSWRGMLLQGKCTYEQLFPDQPARIICATSVSHAYSINAIFTLLESPHDQESELCFAPAIESLHDLLKEKQDKFTLLYGTPGTYTRLMELPAAQLNADIPYCAGTRLSYELFRHTASHCGLNLMQNYGSTETGDIAAWYLHGKRFAEESHHMTSGKAIYAGSLWPGVRVQISEAGEVLVQTPWQSVGYVESGQLLPNHGSPHRTADRGNVIVDSADSAVSALWLQGRIRPNVELAVGEVTVSMSPEQAEQAALAHGNVTDALALMQGKNVEHDSLKLRVVLEEGASVSTRDIAAFVAAYLKLPPSIVDVHVVDFLPCSPAGKLMYT